MWKIEYLKKIYPLITNPDENQFNELECLYTALLPKHIQEELSSRTYRAYLPGPSCSQLPCDCKEGAPDVSFAPNPILRDGWPFCNLPGKEGAECCKSVTSYRKCFKEGKVPWVSNDTWVGNETNALQGPPEYGQLWKPALWPKFTLCISKYDSRNWNEFYNAKGDPDYAWIEGLHSSFSIVNLTYGVWFYRTKGSGIFINLGRTFAALNKIDCILKLLPMEDFVDFLLRKGTAPSYYGGKAKVRDVLDVGPYATGLGGLENLDFWLNGGYHTSLQKELEKIFPNETITRHHVKSYLWNAAYGNYYDVNRLCNTGTLDHLIIFLTHRLGYNSVQFTVQPNVYTGWTTEVMILGGRKILTAVEQMSDSQLRILDPNRLPDGPTELVGKPCRYKSGFACLYCEAAPATMSQPMNCTQDITKFRSCK